MVDLGFGTGWMPSPNVSSGFPVLSLAAYREEWVRRNEVAPRDEKVVQARFERATSPILEQTLSRVDRAPAKLSRLPHDFDEESRTQTIARRAEWGRGAHLASESMVDDCSIGMKPGLSLKPTSTGASTSSPLFDGSQAFPRHHLGGKADAGVTQSGRALAELDIDIARAVTQGRVERAYLTLQDRLVKELDVYALSTRSDS